MDSRRSSRDRQGSRGDFPLVDRFVSRDSNRAFVIVAVFLVIAAIFFIRLFYLGVIVADEYSSQAARSRTVGLSVDPRRGTIYDRNGNILAISVEATTIYANPAEIQDVRSTADTIASVLGGEASDYTESLSASNSTFVYIKRKADVEVAKRLQEYSLPGVYFLADTRREYPYGQVGGQVVGACNVEVDTDTNREYYKGISGLELYYDDVLAGQPGYFEAEVGADGTPIPGGVHESIPAVDGEDIMISLDIDLQSALEEHLEAGLERIGAPTGTAVVMNGETGEIFATASTPYFNPADRSVVEEGATQLKAVSYLFEPGSIFKTVSALSILEENSMDVEDTLYCPATITADDYVISDAHERGDATFTLRQIIDQSSNVGISLATQNMGFDKFYDHIYTYNLRELTGVDYPGEQIGFMPEFDYWSRVTGYNISFGQGISVTPIQMVRFYGALVNDGVECTPHFLISFPQTGQRPTYKTEDVVANKEALPKMTSMLQTVVTEGTGTLAAIDGYDVAGKTSTAEIYDEENGGYKPGVYNLCFAGFIANSSSQLVCFVGANEVGSNATVAPIFKDIMSEAIERYNIVPE